MNPTKSRAVRAGALLAALTVAVPVQAGGAEGKSFSRSGHRESHHGVAIFNRHTRNLPNGVSIFNRRPPASHTHVAKPLGHKHRKHARRRGFRHAKPMAKAATVDRAAGKFRRHGHAHDSKKKHRRHGKKKHVVHGTSVHVLAPAEEYYIPEETDDRDCRSLIERGYDLSGRRVLVEWTLCFDEQGEAYVPEDGRRIVARY